MQTCFSEFQGKIILKCPKFETRWLAHASRIEAPAIVLLGVHHGAFRQKELCSVDVAIFRRVLQRHGASGAFPRKPVGHCGLPADHGAEADVPRGRRTLWAAELYARSTDKRTMNVLDSTPSNCAKQNIFTHNHKHIEQGSWHFVSNKLPSMKRCLLLIL